MLVSGKIKISLLGLAFFASCTTTYPFCKKVGRVASKVTRSVSGFFSKAVDATTAIFYINRFNDRMGLPYEDFVESPLADAAVREAVERAGSHFSEKLRKKVRVCLLNVQKDWGFVAGVPVIVMKNTIFITEKMYDFSPNEQVALIARAFTEILTDMRARIEKQALGNLIWLVPVVISGVYATMCQQDDPARFTATAVFACSVAASLCSTFRLIGYARDCHKEADVESVKILGSSHGLMSALSKNKAELAELGINSEAWWVKLLSDAPSIDQRIAYLTETQEEYNLAH